MVDGANPLQGHPVSYKLNIHRRQPRPRNLSGIPSDGQPSGYAGIHTEQSACNTWIRYSYFMQVVIKNPQIPVRTLGYPVRHHLLWDMDIIPQEFLAKTI